MTDIDLGPPPHLAGGRLKIDLSALAENYRQLAQRAKPARTAGVLKADAYGLGMAPVARTLWASGCRDFFVALPAEGAALRSILAEARIFVLSGLFATESAAVYRQARLIPVLNSSSELSIWEAHGWDDDNGGRICALHVDTGMNRLGLSLEHARSLAEENALTGALSPVLLMSHLACADEPAHPLNQRQKEQFQQVAEFFPHIESSLANSSGIFLGDGYLQNLTRPGIALYGGAPVSEKPNPMRPVVTAETRILQIRHVMAGEGVSYGARPVARDTMIAVCATGYADGYLRSGSGAGVPLRKTVQQGAEGFINGQRVPVLGRITMDLTLFDITDLGPDAVIIGDYIELFGHNIPIDEIAERTGTIAYEILTSMGPRYRREYVGGPA